MPTEQQPEQKFLKLPKVMELTGKSRSAIYADIKKGRFPRQVSNGQRSVVWLSTEIDAWQNSCIAKSNE